MVGHIARGEKERLFDVQFTVADLSKRKELDHLEDDALFEWLAKNGFSDVIGKMYVRRLFPGLLSDFLHFVFEALTCSRKAKRAKGLEPSTSTLARPVECPLVAAPSGLDRPYGRSCPLLAARTGPGGCN
jgi:hypothetical protein